MYSEHSHFGAAVAPVDSGRTSRRRTPHRVPCRLRILGESGTRAVIGETVDLSENGLAVQLGADVAPGARVEVLLPHLAGEPVCFYGEVVRRRRVLSGTFEIGIAFNQPAPATC